MTCDVPTRRIERLLVKTSNWETRMTNVERIPVALVGYGSISLNQHIPTILSDVPELKLVAVAEKDEGRRQAVEDRYGNIRTYEDHITMLEQEKLDGVIVATQTENLADICRYALKRGLNTFVEKPVARNASVVEELDEDFGEANAICQVGFNRRYNYGYQYVKRILEAQELGSLHSLHYRFWFSPPKNPEWILEDLLLNVGIHAFDLVQFFMGRVLYGEARASAVIESSCGTLSIWFPFEQGGAGTIILSSAGSWEYPAEYLEIIGSQGSVRVDNARRITLFSPPDTLTSHEPSYSTHWKSEHELSGFAGQFHHFAGCIRKGVQPDCSLKDAVAALRLSEAVRLRIAS